MGGCTLAVKKAYMAIHRNAHAVDGTKRRSCTCSNAHVRTCAEIGTLLSNLWRSTIINTTYQLWCTNRLFGCAKRRVRWKSQTLASFLQQYTKQSPSSRD